jgi:hypothetical protein
MLRKSEARMAWLVQENGGVVPDVRYGAGVGGFGYGYGICSPAGSVRSDPFYEDGEEEDETSLSTDTDGSSVHTPSESSPPIPPPSDNSNKNSSDPYSQTHHTTTQVPRTSPPSPQ